MDPRVIAVCGATGRQGSGVAAQMLDRGWRVRALTRKPASPAAAALTNAGAEVVRADMDDRRSLEVAFSGCDAVFSVQNGLATGFDRELAQARNVADAAAAGGVSHLVYGSAGPVDAETGIKQWDTKRLVEQHIKALGVTFTSLRPTAFMELMTDKAFFPAFGTWRIWPRTVGWDLPIAWLAARDVGRAAAAVLDRPHEYANRSVVLAGDVKTLGECRALYREATGNDPRSFPMPVAVFDRFTRKDVTAMWRWLTTAQLDFDLSATRALVPDALSVAEWFATARD